ncbi:MAG: Rrf2 family transcriptional regulator [Ilumatobacteraceae bacterium]
MRVSSKGDYAISARCCVDAPRRRSRTDQRARHRRAPAIPSRTSSRSCSLKGAGLVGQRRGVGGGCGLRPLPVDIRLSEILAAVDGPINLGDFGDPHQDRLVRPRGPVRALRDLEAGRRPHAAAAARVHARRGGTGGRGCAPWPDRASILAP